MPDLVKLAEGREAELFLQPDGRVLRLLRRDLPLAAERAALEATALAAAAAAGAPVPAVYEQVTRDGRPGLVLERVEGVDLLTRVTARPWSLPSVARRCGRLHAELHAVTGPGELLPLKDRVERALRDSPAVPGALRDSALRTLESLPDGDRLCHGDFHPANVLQAGDRAVVIDWTTAARGDPVADVARSWVLLEFSPLPPGASAAQRALARAGRGLLLSGYMRAYARAAPLDANRLAAWTRVRSIERLAEEIEGEREPILDRLS